MLRDKYREHLEVGSRLIKTGKEGFNRLVRDELEARGMEPTPKNYVAAADNVVAGLLLLHVFGTD